MTINLTTQNGRKVVPGDTIVVAHNDPWNRETRTFGQWFVAVEKPAAAYDSPHDPILWMPRTGYAGGSARHAARSEELRQLAELIASAIREKLAAAPVSTNRPGDMAAMYAEEAGVSYAEALVACNMD